jgi:cytochrome c biogenesis protein CcmG/thiol:disulfide interchange protein DsbE
MVGVILVALFLCSAGLATDTTPVSSRKAAPDFTLSDPKGAPIRLSDYKGKVVLLDFWATWCHGCQTEIPWYMEFQEKYKGQGLSVIGVAMDDDGWKSVKPFSDEKKINYMIVVGNESMAKEYGVSALPVTLLIDREGKIAALHAGMVDKESFEKEVRTLLQPEKNDGK